LRVVLFQDSDSMLKKITQKSRISSPSRSVLITGGSGSIGRALLPKLIGNYKIYALGRRIESFSKEISGHKNFHFVSCDFLTAQSIPEIGKVDTIIHLGGMVAGKNISSDEYHQGNLHFTKLLLDFGEVKKVKKFVFASSVSVYGKQNCEIDEESALLGVSDYARSKISAEKILLEGKKIPCTIFRIGSVYGPDNKSFVNKLISLANRRIVPFPNSGRDTKNFIYIDDLLEFILLELQKPRKINTIFNLVNPQKIIYRDLVKAIMNLCEIKFVLKIPVGPILLKIVNLFNLLLYKLNISKTKNFLDFSPLLGSQEISSRKAITEFGYHPQVIIEEGIAKILEYRHRLK